MSENSCPTFGEGCVQDTHEECISINEKYAKLVFCNEAKCIWNKDIEMKKYVKRHRDHTPFPQDYYHGICSRLEIAINPETIETIQVKHSLAICAVRSDKGISGHIDWSRFPQGGNIPDPVDPSTAYHQRSD